tara:strand:+ start:1558 stop:1686 length:129 start_codon:yes stop_codon:yes gene_type:complete
MNFFNKIILSYFREATITASDGRVQILGLIAGLEMKLTPNDS